VYRVTCISMYVVMVMVWLCMGYTSGLYREGILSILSMGWVCVKIYDI
jgi:uncharacterized membrane protein